MHNKWRGPGRGGMSLGECQAALSATQQQVAELNEKYLRAVAALDNVRKQAERQSAQQISQRISGLAARLLDVADNLERAMAYAPEGSPIRQGLAATHQQLLGALQQEGVSPIPLSVGAPFDPRYHEAIDSHDADVPEEQVAAIAQAGYTFEGQVLRPARVVVARPR